MDSDEYLSKISFLEGNADVQSIASLTAPSCVDTSIQQSSNSSHATTSAVASTYSKKHLQRRRRKAQTHDAATDTAAEISAAVAAKDATAVAINDALAAKVAEVVMIDAAPAYVVVAECAGPTISASEPAGVNLMGSPPAPPKHRRRRRCKPSSHLQILSHCNCSHVSDESLDCIAIKYAETHAPRTSPSELGVLSSDFESSSYPTAFEPPSGSILCHHEDFGNEYDQKVRAGMTPHLVMQLRDGTQVLAETPDDEPHFESDEFLEKFPVLSFENYPQTEDGIYLDSDEHLANSSTLQKVLVTHPIAPISYCSSGIDAVGLDTTLSSDSLASGLPTERCRRRLCSNAVLPPSTSTLSNALVLEPKVVCVTTTVGVFLPEPKVS